MIITPESGNLLGTALANVLAAATRTAEAFNVSLKADYLLKFDNWSISVVAGRLDNSNPPKPPNGYVVSYFADPTTGPGSLGPYGDLIINWAYAGQGTEPVCAMPPIPGLAVHPSGVSAIMNETDAPGWFAMGPTDATPNGTIVPGTSKDGKSGLFKCVRAPFGGWYLKVA